MNAFLRSRIPTLLAVAGLAAAGTVMMQAASSKSTSSGAALAPDAAGRGRNAEVPEAIPLKGLRDVFWRVLHGVSEDRVTLVAAGVTFYLLLAIFPALAALVSLYGLVADPMTISDNLGKLATLLPPGAFDLFANQIHSLAAKRDSSLGITFFVGLAIALWSTHNGTLALFDAMNVAYEEKEKRGLIRLNLIAICFTVCGMVAAVMMISLVAVLPAALSYVWLGQFKEHAILFMRWPLILAVVMAAVLSVYRFGPSREPARLRWLTWGAVLTIVGLVAMSLGLSFYLSHFANYNATYGTLGALIGFLMWTWLSIVILIVGGELNAELEHQTERDSTTGGPRPMGSRGAYMADTIGEAAE